MEGKSDAEISLSRNHDPPGTWRKALVSCWLDLSSGPVLALGSSGFPISSPRSAGTVSSGSLDPLLASIVSEDFSAPSLSPSSLFTATGTQKSELRASGAPPILPRERETPSSDARERRQSEESVGAVFDNRLQGL
ncbi:hypothetical protein NDU88_003168 [Pleurodeles waltl]|uniref:Uncharacterized protein n=1 Tax=Pleurodeles waltl TaxID=8319 RepID=A0AAV7SFC9_PLEWA|nr:hypothetical protein NDU88_003168 [Pleurodeles waltl]